MESKFLGSVWLGYVLFVTVIICCYFHICVCAEISMCYVEDGAVVYVCYADGGMYGILVSHSKNLG